MNNGALQCLLRESNKHKRYLGHEWALLLRTRTIDHRLYPIHRHAFASEQEEINSIKSRNDLVIRDHDSSAGAARTAGPRASAGSAQSRKKLRSRRPEYSFNGTAGSMCC
ncbi:hypothetical protein EVAR_33710_1 [Eumeta japonica]|uniref:Uncharacterized protein n=1 Tax=Eumeta variegata TaxID=151549 RepID=A0A4C1VU86_EUMVA|nr:hypothetical protein EVAR_33710_1 [Eumeta japonica]